MLIEFDLNTNDSEALLRHCTDFQPASGDCREDSRLADALESLAFAIKTSMSANHSNNQLVGAVDPRLLEAAIRMFEDKTLAAGWLSRPVRVLGGKAPLDVSVEEALALISRLEHGFCA